MKHTPISLCAREKNRPGESSFQSSRSRYLRAFAAARAMRFWRPRMLGKALGTATFAAILWSHSTVQAQLFPASIDLTTLDGTDGFVINGGQTGSAAGDVNGDGIDDIITSRAVVFGTAQGFSPSLDLTSLDGTNGFLHSGGVVSGAGDINGDGFDDLIIGAAGADPNGNTNAGQSYVVYGTDTGFSPSFDFSTLDGTNGFTIDGLDSYDRSGNSVSQAGDINGDGIDDMIIGAVGAGTYGNYGDRSFAGESYVIFGQNSGFSSSFNLSTLDGANGFLIGGAANYSNSGTSVNDAGDVNGDGFDDLIIGAPGGGGAGVGESYVVFGHNNGFSSSLDMSTLNGTNGFRLRGADENGYSGVSVSGAGDINGDGIDDLIIGQDTPSGDKAYVVFGQDDAFSAIFDMGTIDGTNGFVVEGFYAPIVGLSVSDAGDVNGDGFDDLIVGGSYSGYLGDGGGYVVFGSSNGFQPSIDISTLDGFNGFALNAESRILTSVSAAGDVNGDGIDDLILRAYDDDDSYIVFGRAIPEPGSAALFGAGLLGWLTRRRRR